MGRRTCRATPGGGLRCREPEGDPPLSPPLPESPRPKGQTPGSADRYLAGKWDGGRQARVSESALLRKCGEGRRELSGVAGGDDGRALTRHRTGAGGLC